MNLFRNPIVVICLVVVAAALLINSFKPLWQRRGGGRTPAPPPKQVAAPAPAPLASNAPAPSTARQAEISQPERSIDLTQVGWSVDGAPRRDPFQVVVPGATDVARLYPAVSEVLALTAIWHQTGSQLAVINSKVVGVGDAVVASVDNPKGSGGKSFLRYTVESIYNDTVWLQGPAGREELEFQISGQPNRTAIAAR
jgi:hypothetical protein